MNTINNIPKVNIRGHYTGSASIQQINCSAPVKSGDWCTIDSNGNIQPVTTSSVASDIYCLAIAPAQVRDNDNTVLIDQWSIATAGAESYLVYTYSSGTSVNIIKTGALVSLLFDTDCKKNEPFNLSLSTKNLTSAPLEAGSVIALPPCLLSGAVSGNNFALVSVFTAN